MKKLRTLFVIGALACAVLAGSTSAFADEPNNDDGGGGGMAYYEALAEITYQNYEAPPWQPEPPIESFVVTSGLEFLVN